MQFTGGTPFYALAPCLKERNLRPVFHFNRAVPKRGVFLCLVSFQAELMTLGQKKTLRFCTVRLEWKTGFTLDNANNLKQKTISFTLSSAHVKFNVWNGPELSQNRTKNLI